MSPGIQHDSQALQLTISRANAREGKQNHSQISNVRHQLLQLHNPVPRSSTGKCYHYRVQESTNQHTSPESRHVHMHPTYMRFSTRMAPSHPSVHPLLLQLQETRWRGPRQVPSGKRTPCRLKSLRRSLNRGLIWASTRIPQKGQSLFTPPYNQPIPKI